VLGATLLAIGAAFLHAGWNLSIKQSGDRWHALWGQFFVAGVGICSVIDSHGSRETGGNLYPLATFVACALFTSIHGIAMGRRESMVVALRTHWRRFALAGAASVLTYWMVLVAVQRASVGYVTALRESSVVIAALIGALVLKEPHAKRRIIAACVAVAGLVVLVAG
jgi:drug/metabolite transporter (DMT)-like permease